MGVVTEKLSARKGRMTAYTIHEGARAHLEFSVPSRALIGYRDLFLTDTKGTGIMNSYLSGYEEYRGDFIDRFTGSMVSDRSGNCVIYGLYHLEPRGRLFVVPGDRVYEGMIVGEHNLDSEMNVNPCKEKKLSNMRSVSKDEALTLTPIQRYAMRPLRPGARRLPRGRPGPPTFRNRETTARRKAWPAGMSSAIRTKRLRGAGQILHGHQMCSSTV